jgi:cyclic pyranopterin monophosphate synthase
MKLTHVDESGKARMVDVTEKPDTHRVAIAEGKVFMKKQTLDMIESSEIAKGDVLAVARIAGITAVKRTSDLIPLCHTILITKANIDFASFRDEKNCAGILITSEVVSTGKTGVEMEALTAVSVSALTIYDMCKAVDRGMIISDIRLLEKKGGKSGTWKASEHQDKSGDNNG